MHASDHHTQSYFFICCPFFFAQFVGDWMNINAKWTKTAPSVYKHVTSFYFHWRRSETSIPSVSADWARSLGALGNAVAAVAVVCHLFKFYVVYCIASAVWIISFVLMVLHFFSTSLLANLSMFYFALLLIAVFSIVMYVMLTYRLFYLDENVCLYVSSG